MVRTTDLQLKYPGFESSSCRFEASAISFTPRCLSVSSCINKYLAIDSGGYMNEESSRNNCCEARCFPHMSNWCWNEHLCQVVKFKTF